MSSRQAALEFAHKSMEDFLEDLIHFLKIPSISMLAEHDPDIRMAAEWLASQIEKFRFNDVAVISTDGHPIVYGSYDKAGKNAPTILVYGHYDVQPVDPIDEWDSDPFMPQIRNGNVYARGASDMKGQIVAHLKAVESYLDSSDLPVNIKYLIEGEEEIGSPSLENFMKQHEDLLQCDFCLNADSGILGVDTPSLTYALRGLAYFEINLFGPRSDLHSGTFGGPVINPANVIAQVIAAMKDESGRVMLPGFYDDVVELSTVERENLAQLPQTEEWWKEQSGTNALGGETGYSATERATSRPTLDVNGLFSGYIGKGSKTVLPARAMAKISMRLVPNQGPEKIHQSLEIFLNEHVPAGITWEISDLSMALPGSIDLDSTMAKSAVRALESVWGKSVLYKREGGTVPVVGLIKEILGVDSLMLGFGLPDDNLHAPNEKFHVKNFHRGIQSYIHFMNNIAN